jgi:hypothetical protein
MVRDLSIFLALSSLGVQGGGIPQPAAPYPSFRLLI